MKQTEESIDNYFSEIHRLLTHKQLLLLHHLHIEKSDRLVELGVATGYV